MHRHYGETFFGPDSLFIALLYKEHFLQADETPVLVSKDERYAGSKSHMWGYRTGRMQKDRPVILYEYQKARKAHHPREFLKSFDSVVVTDGYEVYHKLAPERQELKIAGCWSHVRRRFAQAVQAADKKAVRKTIAYEALTRIGKMFDLDRMFTDLPPEKRKEQCQLLIKPLVEDFFAWLRELNPRISAKTKTGTGFKYCLNQEEYLKYFLEDGEVPMDNNAAEQAIRGFCIGTLKPKNLR